MVRFRVPPCALVFVGVCWKQLLMSLAMRKNVAKMLLANAAWVQFSRTVSLQLTRDAGVRMLPASALSSAMQALCASISGVSGGDDQRLQTGSLLRDLIAPVVARSGELLQMGHSGTDLLVRAGARMFAYALGHYRAPLLPCSRGCSCLQSLVQRLLGGQE